MDSDPRKRLARPRPLVRAVVWLALLAALGFYVFRNFETNQVYHPSRLFVTTGAELRRPFEDVLFTAADSVRLHGWFYPAKPDDDSPGLVALVCHGNAGNISHRLDLCEALVDNGLSVLLFDYRGYGKSEGKPSEEGTYLDVCAAYDWLLVKGFTAAQIIAYGESLGAAVAAELAVRKPLAGLVLQSTFTSIPDIGKEVFPWLPVRWISRIGYRTEEKLKQIRVPVLILHSRDDRLVRFHHAEKNFAAANEPKLLWELSGDHNDGLGDPAHFNAGLSKFLLLVRNEHNPIRADPAP